MRRLRSGGQHKGYINETELETSASMKAQFPNGKTSSGKRIKQYVLGCVMYNSQDMSRSQVISEVSGLTDNSKELDTLYKTIRSLGGTTVGDEAWRSVESELSSEPMRSWINRFTITLKEQGWTDYVKKQLDEGIAS